MVVFMGLIALFSSIRIKFLTEVNHTYEGAPRSMLDEIEHTYFLFSPLFHLDLLFSVFLQALRKEFIKSARNTALKCRDLY